MKISCLGPQAISRAAFLIFITAMWVRNQNLCLPPAEGGLFVKMYDTSSHHVLSCLVGAILLKHSINLSLFRSTYINLCKNIPPYGSHGPIGP